MSWERWRENKEGEYHKNNEKKRKACIKRAKECFICKVPKGATRISEEGNAYNVVLAAAHLNHDHWNPKARMEALCENCHNKWDGEERQMDAKITNNQGKEHEAVSSRGQVTTNLKFKDNQDKLRRRNRKIKRLTFVDDDWRMRNLARKSEPSPASSPQAEQLSLLVEEDNELLPCIHVDFPVAPFMETIPLVQSTESEASQ